MHARPAPGVTGSPAGAAAHTHTHIPLSCLPMGVTGSADVGGAVGAVVVGTPDGGRFGQSRCVCDRRGEDVGGVVVGGPVVGRGVGGRVVAGPVARGVGVTTV